MHSAEKRPHTPTLHAPPLPSPHHRATPNPSPTFTLARWFPRTRLTVSLRLAASRCAIADSFRVLKQSTPEVFVLARTQPLSCRTRTPASPEGTCTGPRDAATHV